MSLLASFTAGTAPRGTGNVTANTALHTDAPKSAAPVSCGSGRLGPALPEHQEKRYEEKTISSADSGHFTLYFSLLQANLTVGRFWRLLALI
jgi:hypothetical protein